MATDINARALDYPDINTCSVLAFGYNPYLSQWSPYHGAMYAMIEAIAKIVASGARYDKIKFSFQEYFERMDTPSSWGKPIAALLGAMRIQYELRLPAIGGKDSMSGSFEGMHVPPTLIAFGLTTADAAAIISPEFKAANHHLYLVKHSPATGFVPNTEMLKENFDFITKNIENNNIVAAYAIGFGGLAEAVCKMSFGNTIGADIEYDQQQLFNYDYGSILVESASALSFPHAVKLGMTIEQPNVVINKTQCGIDELWRANTEKFETIYPIQTPAPAPQPRIAADANNHAPSPMVLSPKTAAVNAYLPVFPGTNCEHDVARAFCRAGAEVSMSVFRNHSSADIFDSIAEIKNHISKCQILAISGGFSAADEPDGSGKFIANVLYYQEIQDEIHSMLRRGGLILGICNGFQALLKSGLLPCGRVSALTKDSPTLFRNDIQRHVSCMARVRVASAASPWLSGFEVGQECMVAMSHGEGKFVASHAAAQDLYAKGQVAFEYADGSNINGSAYSIEGIISPCGQILGRMGHCERYSENLMKNINGCKQQNIFENAVRWLHGN
jgi:phosphoribosylformylglycinamidine synthase